jgi:3-phosphoshikimate 1-carboxyvinyltransferase
VPVPSAQVKSAVLLAGLNAPGETVVIEREATRDHTERMLAGFGAEVAVEGLEEGSGDHADRPARAAPAGDRGAARSVVGRVSGLCGADRAEGSDVLVPGIGLNPTRAGLSPRCARWART